MLTSPRPPSLPTEILSRANQLLQVAGLPEERVSYLAELTELHPGGPGEFLPATLTPLSIPCGHYRVPSPPPPPPPANIFPKNEKAMLMMKQLAMGE